ncbi:MAG: hypothetical protein IJX76_10270 [Clostridia bacterium]|nr:hypothetical protein [Clostridia bacterium]
MTRTNSNTERLYKLMGALSPELLSDSFPEGAGIHNAPSFRSRHSRRIGKAVLAYAACAVVLVGALLFVPKLMDQSSDPPAATNVDSYFTEDGGWDLTKLSPSANTRDIYSCVEGRLEDPIICLSQQRSLSLTLTAQHQGTESAPYSHTVGDVGLEVLLDGNGTRSRPPRAVCKRSRADRPS